LLSPGSRWRGSAERLPSTEEDVMPMARRLALAAVALLLVAAGPALAEAPAGDDRDISRRGTYEGGRYLSEVPAGRNRGPGLYTRRFRRADGSPPNSPLVNRGDTPASPR